MMHRNVVILVFPGVGVLECSHTRIAKKKAPRMMSAACAWMGLDLLLQNGALEGFCWLSEFWIWSGTQPLVTSKSQLSENSRVDTHQNDAGDEIRVSCSEFYSKSLSQP